MGGGLRGAGRRDPACPWVLLSGGVDDATFERQVEVACHAGASGVLVGRSVWAEAATHAGPARDAFLAGTEGATGSPASPSSWTTSRSPWRPRWAAARATGAARARLVRSGTERRPTIRR